MAGRTTAPEQAPGAAEAGLAADVRGQLRLWCQDQGLLGELRAFLRHRLVTLTGCGGPSAPAPALALLAADLLRHLQLWFSLAVVTAEAGLKRSGPQARLSAAEVDRVLKELGVATGGCMFERYAASDQPLLMLLLQCVEGGRTASVSSESDVPVGGAEGFLCPTCMKSFPSPEELQQHDQTAHLDPSATYLCPVCKARLTSSEDLEQHFTKNHPSGLLSDNVQVLQHELADLSTSLSEERWYSDELRREVARLQQLVEVNQLDGTASDQRPVADTQADSEVANLRKQLTEALKSISSLRQAYKALQEKELVQVQQLMDAAARQQEEERRQLESELQQLRVGAANSCSSSGLTAQLTLRSQTLQSRLDETMGSLDGATEKLAETERQREQLDTQLSASREAVSRLEAELAASRAALEGERQERQAARTEGDARQTRLQELEQESAQLRTQLDALRSQQQQTAASEQQLRAAGREKDERLQEASRRLEDREGKLAALQAELTDSGEEVQRLRSELGELQAKIESGDGAAATAIRQLEAQNASLHQAAAHHRQQAAEQADQLSARLESTQQQLSRAQSQLQERQEDSDRLRAELADTAGRLTAALGSLAETEKHLEEKPEPECAACQLESLWLRRRGVLRREGKSPAFRDLDRQVRSAIRRDCCAGIEESLRTRGSGSLYRSIRPILTGKRDGARNLPAATPDEMNEHFVRQLSAEEAARRTDQERCKQLETELNTERGRADQLEQRLTKSDQTAAEEKGRADQLSERLQRQASRDGHALDGGQNGTYLAHPGQWDTH
ncbi:Early endosome antigen 1 [Amphibalanus amphitrite]|uniref:Early endosome antigen 1 n=1 Tax=Amphibalanus amphitrite TaxID=1232801 RepID=A0A6A4WFE1_AMPAM|nr:Early endosome antigen 1 [Amphibalanus amphitrite]